MEGEMPCPEGGVHDYKLIDGTYICSKCHQVSSYKPVMSYAEALEKYDELLRVCHELVEDEINLNDFKVWLENQ